MEMEMEVTQEIPGASLLERLTAAAGLLEQAAERLSTLELNLEASATTREAKLEGQLAEANATIAALKGVRKTASGGVAAMQAKDGAGSEAGRLDTGSLDAALGSLSIEQRIAVKAGLMRSGLLG